MKINKLFISSSLLVVVILIYGWIGYQKGRQIKTDSYFQGDISKFCINNFCLNKISNGWVIENEIKIPADNSIAQGFANKLRDLKLEEVVSTNPDKFRNLGIDDTKLIIAADNKKLWVGNINQSYEGSYVSVENGKEVYLTKMIIDKEMIGKTDYWVKKDISNINKDKINKITVRQANKTKELNRGDRGWENEKLVDKISHLKSRQHLANFEPEGSKMVEYTIESEGVNLEIIVGLKQINRRQKLYWAKDGDGYYYEIEPIDYDLLTALKF